MNIIAWLLAGAFIGWLASIVVRRRYSDRLLNIIVGMLGAFIAAFLLPSLFRVRESYSQLLSSPAAPQGFSLTDLLFAVGGAIFLVALVSYLRRENNVKNEVVRQRWAQVRDHIHVRWGKITKEDVTEIDGNYSRLSALIQTRYDCTEREADRQIQRYLKSILFGSERKEIPNVHHETP